ncbi:hypothetical protein QQZ08_012232 [Neonectria magnoliae]|uniref:Uncharacterized protein n=1 Tax=Neonectria magnoliae TaxID=2732573 RepID=A0ABR1H486_9HYPO
MCDWVEVLLRCESCNKLLSDGGKKLEECEPARTKTGHCPNGIGFKQRDKKISKAGCVVCSPPPKNDSDDE